MTRAVRANVRHAQTARCVVPARANSVAPRAIAARRRSVRSPPARTEPAARPTHRTARRAGSGRPVATSNASTSKSTTRIAARAATSVRKAPRVWPARATPSAATTATAAPRDHAAPRCCAAPTRSAMNARPPVTVARSPHAAMRTRSPATRTTSASRRKAAAGAAGAAGAARARTARMSVGGSRARRAVRGSIRNTGAASSTDGTTAIQATRVKPRSASMARSAPAGECRRMARRFACRNDTGGAIVDRHMSQEMTIHLHQPRAEDARINVVASVVNARRAQVEEAVAFLGSSPVAAIDDHRGRAVAAGAPRRVARALVPTRWQS